MTPLRIDLEQDDMAAFDRDFSGQLADGDGPAEAIGESLPKVG